MKLAFIFTKRNFKEMLRDPLIYVFCVGFPVLMIIMFQVINHYSKGNTPVFEPAALLPGVMMFSFTFVMLMMSLLVSKDKSTAFLKRLYTSPMKSIHFIIGYAIPGIVIGLIQGIICLLFGAMLAAILKQEFFSFGKSILLILSQLPMLIICVFLGILIGSVLNDKSAPGITSIFISASGILGGAWMPLDTMGGLENFCRVLPFYPSVYYGRIITGAIHSIPNENGVYSPYIFDNVAKLGLIPLLVCFVLSVLFSIICFNKQMTRDI